MKYQEIEYFNIINKVNIKCLKVIFFGEFKEFLDKYSIKYTNEKNFLVIYYDKENIQKIKFIEFMIIFSRLRKMKTNLKIFIENGNFPIHNKEYYEGQLDLLNSFIDE